MKKVAFKTFLIILTLILLIPLGMVSAATTFNNPILLSAPDPFAMRHTDGNYYFLATTQTNIVLRKSATLTGIASGQTKTIWTPPGSGMGCCELWAPEIHRLDNKWYVYFTASSGGGDPSRRVYVLENTAADPMAGSWVNKGAINTVVAGLDGTVWTHNSIRYFLYSGYGNWPDYGSAVYIAQMSNPWTLTGSQVVIAQPTAAWEKVGGMAINEGPAPLVHGSKMYMIFSAGACWSDDYSLGMLSANTSSNPMTPSSWTKSSGPVFAKGNGVYGPGHNSFVKSPDGSEDWLVYHGKPSASGVCNNTRSTRIQKVTWNGDTPVFGPPQVTNITVPAGEPTNDPTPTPSGPTATPNPNPQPVALYAFENNANDTSGNGQNGTLVNGPTFVAGHIGQAVNLDGVNDYVQIPRSVQDSFTIAMWVKTTTSGATGTHWYLGKGLVDGEVANVVNDFGVSLVGSQAAFGVGNADTTIKSTSNINNGAWHRVAVTRNSSSGQMILYFDGVQQASVTGPTGTKNAPANLRIGSLLTNLNFFAGQIDEVRLYNQVLSAAQVAALP